MPWRIADPMSIRLEFVAEACARRRSVAALCVQYVISEKTGFKWLARFRAHGPAGLVNASHGPTRVRTGRQRRSASSCVRHAVRIQPGERASCAPPSPPAHPALAWPAASTITALLDRAGLVRPAGGGAAAHSAISAARAGLSVPWTRRMRSGRWTTRASSGPATGTGAIRSRSSTRTRASSWPASRIVRRRPTPRTRYSPRASAAMDCPRPS